MAIKYLRKNLNIKIYIDKNDIDDTDTVNIYETTDDPSGGTLIARGLKSFETDNDPSSTGDAYLFSFTKIVNEVKTYSFYYTISDKYGNESESINTFSKEVCLTPIKPETIDFDDLDFTGSKAEQGLSTGLIVQMKMNDEEADTSVRDNIENISAVYVTENTEDKSTAGKIGKALSFDGSTDYIDTGNSFTPIFRDSFSINIWAKLVDATPASTECLFGVSDGLNNYFVVNVNGTNIGFFYRASGGTAIDTVASGLLDNTWHMITTTLENFSDVTMRARIYVDNVEVIDTGILAISMGNYLNSKYLYAASLNNNGTDNYHLNGSLDNMTIWSKTLTTDEIDLLWNDGDGTEQNPVDLVSSYYTLYHESLNTGVVEVDGNYQIDTTTFYIDKPEDGDYEYYRTQTDVSCGTESGNSDSTSVNIDISVPGEVPLSDPTNLFIRKKENGTFLLTWNYNALKNDGITGFNIYVDNDGDVSSAGNWVLENTIDFTYLTNRFSYLTDPQAHGTPVAYYIVPVAGAKERFSDTAIKESIADAQAPTVTTDYIETTLT